MCAITWSRSSCRISTRIGTSRAADSGNQFPPDFISREFTRFEVNAPRQQIFIPKDRPVQIQLFSSVRVPGTDLGELEQHTDTFALSAFKTLQGVLPPPWGVRPPEEGGILAYVLKTGELWGVLFFPVSSETLLVSGFAFTLLGLQGDDGGSNVLFVCTTAAVDEIVGFLGMEPHNNTKTVPPKSKQHTVLLVGVSPGWRLGDLLIL